MKAKITREVNVRGDHFFCVYGDDKIVSSFFFKPDSPIGDILNEEQNFSEAMKLAKKIETRSEASVEIVYETKKPETT